MRIGVGATRAQVFHIAAESCVPDDLFPLGDLVGVQLVHTTTWYYAG